MTICRSSISFAGAGVQCGLDEHPESEDHTATVRAEYGAMDTWMPERGDTEATLTWSAPVVGATLEERRAYVLAAREEERREKDRQWQEHLAAIAVPDDQLDAEKAPGLTLDAARALMRHGYDWKAFAAGVSGGKPRTWEGSGGILLRPHVCSLDGIEVDGHEGSDLDPGGQCIHCGEPEDDDD